MISIILTVFFLCTSVLIVLKVRNYIMKSDQKMLENEIQTDFEDEFNVSKYPNESFMQWLENND